MIRRYYQTLLGIVLICISILFLVSIAGYNQEDYSLLLKGASVKHIAGPLGAWIGHLFRTLFGIAALLLILTLIIPSFYLIRSSWINRVTEKTIVSILLMISVSALISLFIEGISQEAGGNVGLFIASEGNIILGRTLSYILFSAISILNLILLIILFLSPEHDHIETTMHSFRILDFWNGMPFIHRKKNIPLLHFHEKLNEKKAGFPWIIKKRIVVFQTETTETPLNFFHSQELPDRSVNRKVGLLTDTTYHDNQLDLKYEDTAEQDDTARDVILQDDEYIVDAAIEPDRSEMPDVDADGISEKEYYTENTGDTEKAQRAILIDDTNGNLDNENVLLGADIINNQVTASTVTAHIFDEIPINEDYIIPTSYLTSSKPLDTESWKNEIRKNSVLLKKHLG